MATRKFSYNNVQLTEFAYNHNDAIAFPLEESSSSDNKRSCHELFLYDSKVNGGSIYKDHISEVALLVIEPNDVSVSVTFFPLLC